MIDETDAAQAEGGCCLEGQIGNMERAAAAAHKVGTIRDRAAGEHRQRVPSRGGSNRGTNGDVSRKAIADTKETRRDGVQLGVRQPQLAVLGGVARRVVETDRPTSV